VLVFDNLSKGHRDAVVDGAGFVQADLRDYAEVVRALRTFDADAVVHLAADSLVGESMTNPAKYYANNVVAGLTLLNAMKAAEVDRVVFSSTAAVYGEPERQPIEETAPTQPTSPYGETKLAFEHALRWHYEAYGISSLSLRYFNAAGATERNGERHSPETHLIPILLQAAAGESEPVIIFGDDYPTRDGTCVRDYIHVLDVAKAHVAAAQRLSDGSIKEPLSVNIGTGVGVSVQEMVDTALRITGSDLRPTVKPRRPGDPPAIVAAVAKAADVLKWKSRFSVEDMVESAWQAWATA
jgi:UDP-glucose 4-epimerase